MFHELYSIKDCVVSVVRDCVECSRCITKLCESAVKGGSGTGVLLPVCVRCFQDVCSGITENCV